MKRFCVSYLSFFDNELRMTVESAVSAEAACVSAYAHHRAMDKNAIPPEELAEYKAMRYDALQEAFFNMDAAIAAIEV